MGACLANDGVTTGADVSGGNSRSGGECCCRMLNLQVDAADMTVRSRAGLGTRPAKKQGRPARSMAEYIGSGKR